MKARSFVVAASMGFMFLLMLGISAEAAELKVLCANGMQTVMEDLGPQFERATGHKLVIAFASGGATVKRARDGEPADMVIAPQPAIDGLVKEGKVAADAVTALASTGISVAIRKGARKPDISSPDALKRALLGAKSITYLNPADGGASGIHFAKVLDRLGIANEVKSKTVFAPKAGAVGALVANGEAEIGVIQYQLLFSVPGIEIVGPLPGDLQDTTVFSAAIIGGAREASRELINFLRSPEAAKVIKAKGMEPGSR
jgi:molybdate transport system substrate-binding protein